MAMSEHPRFLLCVLAGCSD